MATQSFNAAMAIGLQVDAATLNATISGLSGALSSSDGIVLGVADAGTGESGITLPRFTREATELTDVVSSFTRTANSLVRVAAERSCSKVMAQHPRHQQGKPNHLPG